MIRGRAVIGVCVLCALAISAVAAQSAAGATNGTTGFTCKEKKEPGGAGFADAHCKEAVGTGAKFEHVAIPENTTTEGRVTNTLTGGETQVARLLSTQSGVVEELVAKGTEGIANGANKRTETGEHFSEGFGATTYTEVTVTKPAGKGCKLKGEKFETKELKGTSLGTGMEGKLEPAVGTLFGEFTMEGCSIEALNGIYKVEGSIKCPGVGSTVTCTHAATTTQGTLKLRGQKAGVEVSTTATGRANSTEPWTPLAVTTVETP